VVGDILDVARSIHRRVQRRAAAELDPEVRVTSMDEVCSRAYFRCRVADRPGVLATICAVFGEEGVSIASAIQKESDDVSAEFVVTTHQSPDAALRRTRARIADLDVVGAVNTFLRVL
jgi:homoserine dehydrogenase